MKYLAVVLSLASSLLGGPFKLAPSSATLFSDREIYDPGLIPNLPALYTFDNPHPDFGRCGQIGFVSTLEDGSPDPKAIPGFIQINTPCRPEHGFGLELNHNEWREPGEQPTAVPEPIVFWLVFYGLALSVAWKLGSRWEDARIRRGRAGKEIFAIDQVIADEPDLAGGRAAVIQAMKDERGRWRNNYGPPQFSRHQIMATVDEDGAVRQSFIETDPPVLVGGFPTDPPLHLRTPPTPVMRDGEASVAQD